MTTLVVPTNGRVFWNGTHAAIPANWARDTDFDDMYLQGNIICGISTIADPSGHTHTSPNHLHIIGIHTHGLTITGAASGTTSIATGLTSYATTSHTHPAANSAQKNAFNTDDFAIVVNNVEAHPPYYTCILIKPTATTGIPVGSIVFSNGVVPKDYGITDGLAPPAPDLDKKYIRIAATGADAGSTGGAATHTHDLDDHANTVPTHTHADSPFGTASIAATATNSGSTVSVSLRAHHSATLIVATAITLNTTAVTTSAVSNDPAYTKLLGLYRNADSGIPDNEHNGIIIPFVDTNIPLPWRLCDGTNGTIDLLTSQVQVTKTPASYGGTGGSNTHIHTTATHTHVTFSAAHTHSYTFTTVVSKLLLGTVVVSTGGHTHAQNSMASASPTVSSTIATIDSADIRQSLMTCCFGMFDMKSVHILGGNILGANIL